MSLCHEYTLGSYSLTEDPSDVDSLRLVFAAPEGIKMGTVQSKEVALPSKRTAEYYI